MNRRSITPALAGLALVLAPTAPAGADDIKDILFYGNSFTLGIGSTDSVPNLVQAIATAAGHPTPRVYNAAQSGQDLFQHLQFNAGWINGAIPADEDWEAVVLQGHSTRVTTTHPDGNIPQHRAAALGLYNLVAARSPGAQAVMYETWARAPGHSFYTGANPIYPGGPSQMQAEVRAGYELSSGDINAAYGPGTARIARVGDAWELANWDRLHHSDMWHAQNRGTLLASLVIYGNLYDDTTTADIPLDAILTGLALTPTDGAELTQHADAILVPEPGTAWLAALAALIATAGRRGQPARM